MRNKSRKRILHEQRVEIAKLRRIIDSRSRYIPTPARVDTLVREFYVPIGVCDSDTVLEHEAYKTVKEIMQQLIRCLEIQYEESPDLHSARYTVILRVVHPSTSQNDAEAFMKAAVRRGIYKYPILEPECVEWSPSENDSLKSKRKLF